MNPHNRTVVGEIEQSSPVNKHLTKYLHCARFVVQTPENHGHEPQSKLRGIVI
jgi:hypothetical protein